MSYSKNYDLETALDETKSYLDEQYKSIDTIKSSVRDLMSSAGLIIALLSLLQINIHDLDFLNPSSKELLVLSSIIFYIILIIIGVFLLMPIKMFTPMEISKITFQKLFYNKEPKKILENRIENYLNIVEQNRRILKKASFLSKISSIIYILIILLLVISLFKN